LICFVFVFIILFDQSVQFIWIFDTLLITVLL